MREWIRQRLVKVEHFARAAQAWVRSLQERPQVAAACISGTALALVAAAGVVLWSCESAPRNTGVERGIVAEVPREPEVRVRVRNNIETARLDGPAEMVLRSAGRALPLPAPLVLAATSDGLRITDKAGATHLLAWPVEVESSQPLSAAGGKGYLRIDDRGTDGQWKRGHAYAGSFRIHLKGSGTDLAAAPGRPVLGSPAGSAPPPRPAPPAPAKMEIIETLPLERYLGGVLPAELPAGGPQAFHANAFHVQAVCARSYALHQRARAQRLNRTFDLEAGESDQAYIGAPEIPVALKAVEETRGVVLTWQGQVLRTYYSSTCGGRPASAAKVWPTGTGFEFNLAQPIQAHTREHACQHSPAYAWEQTRDVAEMSTRIREWGKANGHAVRGLKTIVSLRVDEAVPTGRPSRYVLRDNTGATFPITAELLRNACNFDTPGIPPRTRETRIRSGDLEMDVQGSKVVIRGRGFGHGVGMCQYCIDGFASRGDDWRAMAVRFYPGAKLERAY